MRILQLCCFTNLWPSGNVVESWDLKHGKDIFDITTDYAGSFDLIVAAPPCDQFTKANSGHWSVFPIDYIRVAERCFDICRLAPMWVLENPPGRIEKFLPELTRYRVLTWSGLVSNKEYVVYSTMLFLHNYVPRYGKSQIPWSKIDREKWQPDFVETMSQALGL
jgi:hypothetical protein